ncbi:DNA methylase [Ferrithrix thermotolerans DSM 19514]|uniref:Methyltransferase n=2 Tax=Ferrithrix TaxID=643949 RepID=A0A1M4YCT0_9ACTN|nr:DNA methylase [Ferrithrix thermotolerans DSM 19514]
MPIELPLSVWLVGQRTGRAQRSRRYPEISGTQPAKMLPAIAERAVATYTQPGDMTLDPMCGVGTTLVEAVHQGCDAIGIECEPEWADYAQANLALAASQGASGHGEVICGDRRSLASLIDPVVRSLVALVLTSPPHGPPLHGRVNAGPGHGVRKTHDRYSTDPANLAHIGLAGLVNAMRTLLRGAAQVLRPDGVVAQRAAHRSLRRPRPDRRGSWARSLRAERRPPRRTPRRHPRPPGVVLRPRTGSQSPLRRAAPPGHGECGFVGLEAPSGPGHGGG